MTLQEILGWLTSGEGRLVAAALLFVAMFALERVPYVRDFINFDGWKLGEDSADAWLSSKRKKVLANVLLASAPAAYMLTTDAAIAAVMETWLTAVLASAGVNAKLNAAKKSNPDTKAK